jgi:alpha-methylacyl-CoA racemase
MTFHRDQPRHVGSIDERDASRVASVPNLGGTMTGPLHGVRIIEIAGLGAAPFAGMMLADAGADVIRVDRADETSGVRRAKHDPLGRGKRSVAVDLRSADGRSVVHRMVECVDGLIEGFRPGVAERLGIGPSDCMAVNQRLVYGRMTGWGQTGSLAASAGHDINYIALAGLLGQIGRAGERPVPPLNVVGDFGGGGMILAFGMVTGILSARSTGFGQVIDAAMVDGAALLMAMIHGFAANGKWVSERGVNLLDTGAPFYEVYETADRQYMAVGAIEPKFYFELVGLLGLDSNFLPAQMDRPQWPAMKELFASRFKSRTRAEWTEVFEGSDACVTPVLSMSEAPRHPHNIARRTFIEVGGADQPAPAPRFSSMAPSASRKAPIPGQHTDVILGELGLSNAEVQALRSSGTVAYPRN